MKDFMKEKEMLEKTALKPDETFTNEELVPRLVNFQQAISDAIFSSGMAEKIRPQDLARFLEDLARENGVERDATFCRLNANLHFLGRQIGGLKKGAKGEDRTKLGLRNLEFLPNIKIFYNITLGKDPADRTEYDAIVLTPFGIFVVETKNYRGDACITEKGLLCQADDTKPSYNLGEKMNTKEFLLRRCIGKYSSIPYHSMLLYADENANVKDDFHQVPVVYCNTASQHIKDKLTGPKVLSQEELQEIEALILDNQVVNPKYPCRINCQEIIDDLIDVLTRIANSQQPPIAPPAPTYQLVYTQPMVDPKAKRWAKIKTVVDYGLCIVGGSALGVAGCCIYDSFHSKRA